jgi:hypothetical protein
MRSPIALTEAYGKEFEALVAQFLKDEELISNADDLHSPRFLKRSVLPHVEKLSNLFNRKEDLPEDDPEERAAESQSPLQGPRRPLRKDPKSRNLIQSQGLEKYWKESSNPKNLRLAYFLAFMPANQARVATVWAELHRLGFKWNLQPKKPFKGIELGAGPATGACGVLTGEKHAPMGLPEEGNFALLEQDKATLEMGVRWTQPYFSFTGFPQWTVRPFHRTIDLSQPLLPRSAPSFHLWLTSYYLNESSLEPAVQARTFLEAWERHLEDEGLVIFVEPALKQQSRRLLELRKAILDEIRKKKIDWLKILTPCLGHQSCGALSDGEDWCHDEAVWWRPPYLRKVDQMAGLDRRSLPFSYLVLSKSKRSIEEILPALGGSKTKDRYRLVSPAHAEGRDLEFFICGQEGKRRARYRPTTPAPSSEEKKPKRKEKALQRGDILLGAELRGDTKATRIEKIDRSL